MYGMMVDLMMDSGKPTICMVMVSTNGLTIGFIKATTKMTKNMAMDNTFGQMEESLKVSFIPSFYLIIFPTKFKLYH